MAEAIKPKVVFAVLENRARTGFGADTAIENEGDS